MAPYGSAIALIYYALPLQVGSSSKALISIDFSKDFIEAVRTGQGPEERQQLVPGPKGMGVCSWEDGSTFHSDVPNLTISSRAQSKIAKKPAPPMKRKRRAKAAAATLRKRPAGQKEDSSDSDDDEESEESPGGEEVESGALQGGAEKEKEQEGSGKAPQKQETGAKGVAMGQGSQAWAKGDRKPAWAKGVTMWAAVATWRLPRTASWLIDHCG